MELRFFNTLSGHPDYRHLLTSMTCVGERYLERLPVLLFQDNMHYVEVVFNHKGTSILASRKFSGTDDLEPYLEQIALPQF